ncbi:MAG: DUF1080 domain-containing protein [Planctomycetia bacterium]|nr:DUF1080 domain-containing protein [Planctomycetia bacterium]
MRDRVDPGVVDGSLVRRRRLYGAKSYRDFEWECEVKLQGTEANAGGQFRNTMFDPATHLLTGPQADIGRTGKTGHGGLWCQIGPRMGSSHGNRGIVSFKKPASRPRSEAGAMVRRSGKR